MDTFKKIYTAIMGLTVISIIVLCLYSLGIVDYGSNESLYRVLLLSVAFCSISFLFSRSANVIANRKNTAFAYIAVFIGLAFVLGAALEVIFNFSLSINIIYIIACCLIGVTLLILVLEVPPANSSHTKFQIITVILVLISFIWNVSDLYQTVNSLSSDSILITEEEVDGDEEDSNSDTIKTVITFGAILCFLLNPMIRVHYLEIDYELTSEIDSIIKDGLDKRDIPKKKVLPKQEEKKVEEPSPMIQGENSSFINKNPVDVNIPIDDINNQEVQEIVETQGMTPDGKVINPNFKQEDLAEAVIPTIDGLDNNSNATTEVEAQPKDTPTISNNETKEPNQQ